MKTRKTIITGLTRGLGRALTERFIQLGHTVIDCGRSSEKIDHLRQPSNSHHRFDTDMLRLCFGESAGNYANADAWAEKAVTFILGLGPQHNGQSLSV